MTRTTTAAGTVDGDRERAKALADIERAFRFAKRGDSPNVGRATLFAMPTFCLLAGVQLWIFPIPWAAIIGATLLAYVVGWRTAKFKSASQRLYVLLEKFEPRHVDLYKRVQKEARDGSPDSFEAALVEWVGCENQTAGRSRPLSATEQAKEAFLSKQL